MAIKSTMAAEVLEDKQENISSHELISLLMAGGLERINQAKISLSAGEKVEAEELIQRIVEIINGLRSSLNLENGGEIASNLDALYHYMIDRIVTEESDQRVPAIEEVGRLLTEVKGGWDEMDVN